MSKKNGKGELKNNFNELKGKKCFHIVFDKIESSLNMRYDAIYKYVDKEDENYCNYYVPEKPIGPMKAKVSIDFIKIYRESYVKQTI